LIAPACRDSQRCIRKIVGSRHDLGEAVAVNTSRTLRS
jgi:hypothetical protein